MGQKGDRASKDGLARRMYADGLSLAEIARQIDVSETTLRKWKSDDMVPGAEMDEWDRARAQKRGNITRLKDLFERQLEYVESLHPSEVTAPMMDTLSKLGSLVERWDKAEAVVKRLADLEKTAEKTPGQGISVDTLRRVRQEIYGI